MPAYRQQFRRSEVWRVVSWLYSGFGSSSTVSVLSYFFRYDMAGSFCEFPKMCKFPVHKIFQFYSSRTLLEQFGLVRSNTAPVFSGEVIGTGAATC